MGYDEFKNKICLYYGGFENTKSKLSLFKSAFDRIVKYELPSRDEKRLFQVRDFVNSEGLRINICTENMLCSYSEEKTKLFVGTISPFWKRGLRDLSKDPFVSEQIEIIFHFINQYIYRSSQINLIGAIALTYGECCHYNGNSLSEFILPEGMEVYNKFHNNISHIVNNRCKTILHYLEIINALDPFVNKAIYYYSRCLSLRRNEFDEESVTCADNMVDTITQAIKYRLCLPTMQRKDMNPVIEQELSISKSVTEKLDSLYQLRCDFTAHPAQSKWWDFSEIYYNDIDAIMDSVKTLLVKYCMYERNHCTIQRNPEKWSNWFLQYSDIVLDAVWFHRLPLVK
ncbi:MAG: hypothetical protein ACYDEX_26005 [Mobilitalea sp.]